MKFLVHQKIGSCGQMNYAKIQNYGLTLTLTKAVVWEWMTQPFPVPWNVGHKNLIMFAKIIVPVSRSLQSNTEQLFLMNFAPQQRCWNWLSSSLRSFLFIVVEYYEALEAESRKSSTVTPLNTTSYTDYYKTIDSKSRLDNRNTESYISGHERTGFHPIDIPISTAALIPVCILLAIALIGVICWFNRNELKQSKLWVKVT